MKKMESIKKDLFKKLKSIELFKNDEINNLENITGGGTTYYYTDGTTLDWYTDARGITHGALSCEEPGILGPGSTFNTDGSGRVGIDD